MAWRKADNWTASPTGTGRGSTGRKGWRSGWNTDRFPWEAGASPAAPHSRPSRPGMVRIGGLAGANWTWKVPRDGPACTGRSTTAYLAPRHPRHAMTDIREQDFGQQVARRPPGPSSPSSCSP